MCLFIPNYSNMVKYFSQSILCNNSYFNPHAPALEFGIAKEWFSFNFDWCCPRRDLHVRGEAGAPQLGALAVGAPRPEALALCLLITPIPGLVGITRRWLLHKHTRICHELVHFYFLHLPGWASNTPHRPLGTLCWCKVVVVLDLVPELVLDLVTGLVADLVPGLVADYRVPSSGNRGGGCSTCRCPCGRAAGPPRAGRTPPGRWSPSTAAPSTDTSGCLL